MKRQKTFRVFAAYLLTICMLSGLFPGITLTSAAAEVDPITVASSHHNTNQGDGITLMKKAEPKGDGTVDISIGAYTTGEVVSHETATPTDIVLVLDVSGSMDDNAIVITGYEDVKGSSYTEWYFFVPVTQYGLGDNDFYIEKNGAHIPVTYAGTDDNNYDYYTDGSNYYYPIMNGDYANQEYDYEIVQFSSAITETQTVSKLVQLQTSVKAFIADIAARNAGVDEASQHRVAIVTYAAGSNTAKALTAVNSDTKASFDSTIEGLDASGATRIDLGMSTAYDILTNKTSTVDRENVVIAFTDGVPTTNTAFNQTVAGNAINTGADIKKSGATIYSVSMTPGADASADISYVTSDSPEISRTNQFMHFLSSNFPNSSYSDNTLNGGTGGSTSNGYYMTTDTTGLEQIFDKISTEIGTPHITMGSSAVLTDSISSYFDLIGVTDGNGKNSSITLKTVAKTADGWADTGVEDSNLSYTLSADNKTIHVTGFDFDANYVSAENRGTGEPFYGKMLLITMNVKPNNAIIDAGASVHNGSVPTNADNAFLTDSNGETRAEVAKPTLDLPKVTYKIEGEEPYYKLYYRLPGDELEVIDPITRTGYKFVGWTPPAGVDVDANKYTMPNNNIEFTGNFAAIKYNVTYVYSGTKTPGAPALPETKPAEYNSIVTVATTPSLTDYTFVGWTPLGEDIKVEDNKFKMPARDVTLVGHFEPDSSTPYKVEHYLQNLDGTTYTLKDTEDKIGITGETATAVPKTTYTGFIYDEDNASNVTSGAVSSSLVLKLYYNRITYDVSYLIDGVKPDGAEEPSIQTDVMYGETVNVAENLSIDGYVFSGWANDTIPTDPNYVAITAGGTFTMPAANVNISGYFTASTDTPYTVLHYLENLDGTFGDGNGGLDPAKTETFRGVTDTDATANPVNFTGFTYDEYNTTGLNITSGTIEGDGSLVLKLYYTRDVYSVKYIIDGAVHPDGVTAPEGNTGIKFGKEVTVEPNLTIDGYTFTGWKNDAVPTDPSYVSITAGGTFTMPAANVVISGSFFRDTDTKYTVEHYLENIDGTYGNGNGGKVAAKTEQFAGETDTLATAIPVEFTGFTHDGNDASGAILGDGSLVLKLYYNRNTYSVTYLIDGTVKPEGVTAPIGIANVKFGHQVTVEPNLTAEGYTFTGWRNDAALTDPNYVTITAGGTFAMPAADVVIAGSFIHNTNTKYTVEHYLKNVSGSLNEYGDGNGNATPAKTEQFTGTTDADVTAKPVIFTGFTYDESKVSEASGKIKSDGSLVLKLYYNRNKYNLTYVYNGVVPDDANPTAEQLKTLGGSYEHGATITIAGKSTSPSGYDFHGWTLFETGSEITEPTFTMPARDVVLVGHFHAHTNVPYRIEHYLQNLDGTYPTTPYSHESRTGTTGASVTVYAHKYDGFIVDEAKINANNDANLVHINDTTNYTLTDNVKENGTLTLRFYYKRNTHTVTYKFNGMVPTQVGEKKHLYETVTMNVPFGTPMNVTVIPAEEYLGYLFSGWATDDVKDFTGATTEFTMPDNDVLLTSSFTALPAKYTVLHLLENLEGNTEGEAFDGKVYTVADTETHEDRMTGALVEAVPKHYTGFSPNSKSVLEGKVKGDPKDPLVLNVYYDRHRYDVSYIYQDDDKQPDNRPALPAIQEDVQYGTKLTVEDKIALSGYTFDGWHTLTATVTEEDGSLVYTMPDHDVVFLGKFVKKSAPKPPGGGGGGGGANTRILTYESNGGTEYDQEVYGYGREVDITKAPEREGYTFEGWYLDENFIEEVNTVTMNKNITVYAKWHYTGEKPVVPGGLNGDDHFAYVIGYPDGTVRPSANITRAEVAAIFFRLLKDETRAEYLTDANSFADVADDAWYKKNVATLAALGIIEGRTATEFKPDEMITRAEFAVICARFDNSETDIIDTFTDVAGHWAEADIHEAAAHGWIKGYEDNTFRPEQFITRAEAMTLINRVLCRVPEKTSDLLDGMVKWSDNMNEDAWYYLAIQEATNSHDFSMKNETYEKWTALNDVYDWAKYQD